MKTSIVIFDKFTDIDRWFMWGLLNRVRIDDLVVKPIQPVGEARFVYDVERLQKRKVSASAPDGA